jgi:hypothetical protein
VAKTVGLILSMGLSLSVLSGCTFTPVMGETETAPPPTVTIMAPRLNENGFGDFRFGEPVDTSRADVEVMGEATYGCTYVRVPQESGPLMLMLIDGRLARIDIDGPAHQLGGRAQALANGLTTGSTVAEIKAVYGARAVATPNKYDYDGTNYEVDLSDTVGLVFETADGKVTTYRVGLHEQVRWVEGCS